MKLKYEYIFLSLATLSMLVFSISVIRANQDAIHVSSHAIETNLSNTKIGWGIKKKKMV